MGAWHQHLGQQRLLHSHDHAVLAFNANGSAGIIRNQYPTTQTRTVTLSKRTRCFPRPSWRIRLGRCVPQAKTSPPTNHTIRYAPYWSPSRRITLHNSIQLETYPCASAAHIRSISFALNPTQAIEHMHMVSVVSPVRPLRHYSAGAPCLPSSAIPRIPSTSALAPIFLGIGEKCCGAGDPSQVTRR